MYATQLDVLYYLRPLDKSQRLRPVFDHIGTYDAILCLFDNHVVELIQYIHLLRTDICFPFTEVCGKSCGLLNLNTPVLHHYCKGIYTKAGLID